MVIQWYPSCSHYCSSNARFTSFQMLQVLSLEARRRPHCCAAPRWANIKMLISLSWFKGKKQPQTREKNKSCCLKNKSHQPVAWWHSILPSPGRSGWRALSLGTITIVVEGAVQNPYSRQVPKKSTASPRANRSCLINCFQRRNQSFLGVLWYLR